MANLPIARETKKRIWTHKITQEMYINCDFLSIYVSFIFIFIRHQTESKIGFINKNSYHFVSSIRWFNPRWIFWTIVSSKAMYKIIVNVFSSRSKYNFWQYKKYIDFVLASVLSHLPSFSVYLIVDFNMNACGRRVKRQ